MRTCCREGYLLFFISKGIVANKEGKGNHLMCKKQVDITMHLRKCNDADDIVYVVAIGSSSSSGHTPCNNSSGKC